MVYKVWARDGAARMWCYDFFRETVNGAIYSYDKEDQIVHSAIFMVKKPIPQSMFDHYFFDYEILSDE